MQMRAKPAGSQGRSPAFGPEVERVGNRMPYADAMQAAFAPYEDAPVQRRESEGSSPAEGDTQAVAQHGVSSGAGAQLPHYERIQKSFGAHDISNVRAHIGGKAAVAANDLGAVAYATGSDVAFDSKPDLHTAAHEASHVVQQRAGVHLKGGVGQAGDQYEQHADHVADLVVAGESAEGVLSQMASAESTSGRPSGAVQQKKKKRKKQKEASNTSGVRSSLPGKSGEAPSEASSDSVGVGQSLGRGGAAGFSDGELFDGMTDTRHALAGSKPGSVEADDHEQNLTILQWEASERGFSDSSPGADAATAVKLPSGVEVSASAAHLRYLVEEEVRWRGNPFGLIAEVREAARSAEVEREAEEEASEDGMCSPGDQVGELQQILLVLESEATLVLERNKAFATQFKTRAHRTAWSILDESKRRVLAEMDRYGMSVDREQGFGGARSEERSETKAMRAAAERMAISKQRVDALTKKRRKLVSGFGYPNIMSTMPKGESSPSNDEERGELAAADAELKAAEIQHVQLRMVLESQYPALARYKSAGELGKVAKGNDAGPDKMAWDLDENLIKIAEARDALASKDLDPMTLPEVVGMTKQALMVPSGSMRSQIVGKMVSDAKPSRVRAFAIAAITIGLGLLAIPLSGGASMGAGASAAVVAVEGVALGIDAVLLSRSVSEYMVKKAAGGTDPDRARALSQEDPSLGWLAVEILATGVGAGAAIKTFRSLAAARRAALQSQGPLELEKGLRELRQLGEGAGLSEKSQRRLVGEVQEKQTVTKASAKEPGKSMNAGEVEAQPIAGVKTAKPPTGRALPELPVRVGDVFDTNKEKDFYWSVQFRVTSPRGDHYLGEGAVMLEDGAPRGAPSFVLNATTDSDPFEAIRIYDDVVDGVGSGERHSLTTYAIKTLLREYRMRFGHLPEALEGSLAWSNKLNFQTEYHELLSAGVPSEEAAVTAIKKVSFGKHRIAAGYSDFEVTLKDTEWVELEGFGRQKVPKKISVTARRGDGGNGIR